MFTTSGGPTGSTFVTLPPGATCLPAVFATVAPSFGAVAPVGCCAATVASSLQTDPPALPAALEPLGPAPVAVPEEAAVPVAVRAPLGTCLAPLAGVSVTAVSVVLFLVAVSLPPGAPLGLDGTPPSFWGAFPLGVEECFRWSCCFVGGEGGGLGPPPMAPPPLSKNFPAIFRRPPSLADAPPPLTSAGTCRGIPPPGGCGRALNLPLPSARMGVGI